MLYQYDPDNGICSHGDDVTGTGKVGGGESGYKRGKVADSI